MTVSKSLLVFLTAAATLPAATISATASCDLDFAVGPIVYNPGGPGFSQAGCSFNILDPRQELFEKHVGATTGSAT
jgi:hypothetical protein